MYPKPDSRYGVSKAFNEALSSLYADRYGMEMFCMRIGNVNREPIDRRRLAIWVSGRDMAQLVTIGIEMPNLRFEIVYGISDNKGSWFDNSNAWRLGYRPQDRSEPYAEEILGGRGRPANLPADIFQGGGHCMSEGGTRSRLAGEEATKPKGRRAKTQSKRKGDGWPTTRSNRSHESRRHKAVSGEPMNKELRAIVGNVLESNLAIMSAFIALASSLTEEQQVQVLEPLAKAKQANQALFEMIHGAGRKPG